MKPVCAFIFSSLLFFTSCNNSAEKVTQTSDATTIAGGTRYAKRFAIEHHTGYALVAVFGNKNNFDTTASWVVYPENSAPVLPAGKTAVKSPCRRIAALSSIYAGMLCELGSLEHLVAIDNIDYVNNSAIRNKHNTGGLKELAKGPELDLEQTVALHPDVLFTFGMGGPQKTAYDKLEKAGIPVAVSLDHLEESPLARAEWIKFYAVFAGKEATGDSLFRLVEENYLALKKEMATVASRPSVFSEIKYGDVWYVPGGKSFMAQLIQDAGGNYIWRDDNHTGSLPLSFEEVYAKARNADYWINLPGVKSRQELLAFDPRYKQFRAFELRGLYNNDRHANALGYSTYWETGMTHPDRILSDLTHILHPGRKHTGKDSLFYYRQLP